MLKRSLKISFLVDDNPGPGCPGEHGLSIFIEADIKILFDAGQSRLFLENAGRLGVDPASVDCLVLSHGHYDHGNGFEFLTGERLICHPDCFIRRYRDKDSTSIGLKFDRHFAKKNFDLVLSAEPLKLSESVFFLGAIPRSNSFESKQTSFFKEDGTPDFVSDDSALVIDTDEGLVVIAGCGHSGICNIIEYAKSITGKSRIAAVAGGFHLKDGSPAIMPTVAYLMNSGVELLMPCHCVDAAVIRLFNTVFTFEPVFAGKIKEFN
ncbi:MAG: MBL fold metallo-hydrolase [Candidatus Riflebacteria bacterium]|nr:MBL fold metallo-hydrolase [Candidatus Riflebacteria bacterium]